MDHETNKQEPSSTEGGEMKYKVGDKVWVLCEVAMDHSHQSLYVDIRHDGAVFEAKRSDCRPVEPTVIKDCLTTESNSPKIPDVSSDPINPSHYKQGGIECIEAIKAATGDGFIGYVWGNVLKYLWRWPKKGGVDDLKKARWYLDRLIQEVGE
jgi:hypothetical protein